MPYLAKLTKKFAAQLTSAELEAVQQYSSGISARRAYAYPEGMTDLDAQTGFILFERAFEARPVNMYGQDVPSLAHTIVRVFRAKKDDASNVYEVGEQIFAARISEKALTEAMLNSDMGSQGAPLTVMNLGDFQVPERATQNHAADIGSEQYRNEHAQRRQVCINDVTQVLSQSPERSSKPLREAAHSLSLFATYAADSTFELQQHLLVMSRYRNQALTEAANAALHVEKVRLALSAVAQPKQIVDEVTPHDVYQHAMLNTMMDPITLECSNAARKLLVAELKAIAQDNPDILHWINTVDGIEVIDFPNPRDRSVAVKKANAKTSIDTIANIWNDMFNPSLQEDRQKFNPSQASLSVGRRSGSSENVHSSLPGGNESTFQLTICPSITNYRFGVPYLESSSAALIELEITGQDLMTALRGHPGGLPLPCSLSRVAGYYRARAARPVHQVTEEINQTADALRSSSQVQSVNDNLKRFNDLVNSKRSGKAWLNEIQIALEDLDQSLILLANFANQNTDDGKADINNHVAQSARQMLGEISKTLPSEILTLLRITGD